MKKITKALVLALCLALAVCAFAVVSSAEAPAGSTVEVTVDGNTTYYNDFDSAWAAARAGESAAVVKLIGDAGYVGCNDVDDGTNAEDITLDLNGHTLTVNKWGNINEAFRVITHGSKFKICDTSVNGGGEIVTAVRLLTIGAYDASFTVCPYYETIQYTSKTNNQAGYDEEGNPKKYDPAKKFVSTNDNHADIDIDNVTITCNDAKTGDEGRAVIWAFNLCADIDITNSTINAPNVGMILIEENMTMKNNTTGKHSCHALYIDVANTKINVNTFVVELEQNDGTSAVNLYTQENMTWNFSNCDITSNGEGNGYVFFYDVEWYNVMNNFIPSYGYLTKDANKLTNGSGKTGEVAPSKYAPHIYLYNCTLDTKGDGLVGVRIGKDNPVNVYIAGGSYRIDTDAEAEGATVNGDNFIRRPEGVAQSYQRVLLSPYADKEGVVNPEFNFDPSAVTNTVYGGIYAATTKKETKTSYEITIAKTASTYSVEKVDKMYKLVVSYNFDANLLYNLSLSDKLSINLAVPSSIVKQVKNATTGTTIGSSSSMTFTNTDGVEYKVFQFKNISVLSVTDAYSFIVVNKTSLAEQVVQISILDYAKAVLAGEEYDTTEKELARSIIAYALEAEKLADPESADVATLTAALAVADVDAPATLTEFADAKLDDELADTPLYGAAIDFSGDSPALVLVLDEALEEDYTITVSYTGNRKAVNTKDYTFAAGATQVTLSGISAFDFGNDITITIDETDYVFNLAALLNRLMAADAEYTGFANALYNYVNAAKAYQADSYDY